MKVRIKNLHITFMGAGEPQSETPPKEFYSPLERELRAELEKANSALSLEKTAAKMYQTASETLCSELDQIKGWCNDYDDGNWPDHNATPVGKVAREVLHMMRDMWADLETRTVPPKLKPGVRMVESLEINENVTLYGDCLYVAFRDDGRPIGAWHSKEEAVQRAASFNRASAPIPQTAAELAQPVLIVNPVGVDQPAPETSQTQPAGPESAMSSGPTGSQAPKAKICPGFGCDNLLTIEQTVCDGEDCPMSINERFPKHRNCQTKTTH